MKKSLSPPEIYVYKPNREDCVGVVKSHTGYTEDVRFNSCSEVSFTVPQKYYNLNTEQWESNEIYNHLVDGNLLRLCDDSEYFKYPIRRPGGDSFYSMIDHNNVTNLSNLRSEHTEMSYQPNSSVITDGNFAIQRETKLFDIGHQYGYTFTPFKYLYVGDPSADSWRGSVADYSYMLNSYNGINAMVNGDDPLFVQHCTCEDYIPVSSVDILAIRSYFQSGFSVCCNSNGSFRSDNAGDTGNPYAGTTLYPYRGVAYWRICFYTDADSATYVGSEYIYALDGSRPGVERFYIGDKLPNGGYIRIGYETHLHYGSSPGDSNINQQSCDMWLGGNSSSYSYAYTHWYPDYGYIVLYSGERRCTEVKLADESGFHYPKLHWFVITASEENDDGVCRTKTITAKSYEYTLSKRTISVSDDTLPFYIPSKISTLVGSNASWYIDCYADANNEVKYKHKRQKLLPGILNDIVNACPGWSVANVSKTLMTKYRTLSAVDDVNIYSYLMDNIQKIYNCFIVFDSDNRTISAYTKEDLFGSYSNNSTPLTWNNAIKSFQKTERDESKFTSLRVHTGDDTYGIGLINPTGNNIVYNFNNILADLNFYPSSTSERTLREAVEIWQAAYNNTSQSGNMSTPTLGDYRAYGKALIDAYAEEIQLETALSRCLSQYRAKVVEINTYLKDDLKDDLMLGNKKLLPDRPLSVTEINSRNTTNSSIYHSGALKNDLIALSRTYYYTRRRYDTCVTNRKSCESSMQQIANKFVLNPNSYTPSAYLSRDERIALAPYIKEGTWTMEEIAFSDTYEASDIYNTLVSAMTDARYDLTNRIGKTNYDFSVDTTNIKAIEGLQDSFLWVGGTLSLYISRNELIKPILLETHLSYDDLNDFSMTFTTDMNRRVTQYRFADLFSTITQTSVADNSFTFDT